jgi:plasmid stabilization system protein ParE
LRALGDRPQLGRKLTKPGWRRLVVSPYPYLIDYRVKTDEIVILRFRHAARRP